MKTLLLLSFYIFIFTACNNNQEDSSSAVYEIIQPVNKVSGTDPFAASITPSEFFIINARQDTVIEGAKGTIIVCPKGCFKNNKGEIVREKVKIELAEALSLEEMLLSNLTTTSNGQQLETDGMMYINATLNGEQLIINKENPVRIEIPTRNKKLRMMVYEGRRDEKGNMNWVNPKKLENFLVPVDLDLLDFLPENFQSSVQHSMPYRNHLKATKALTDSLYFMLSVSDGSELIKGFMNTNINELYDNLNKKIVNNRYTKESYEVNNRHIDTSANKPFLKDGCGIDPAMIKVITSGRYQNSLIATREFEARLKTIFKTCNKKVFEIYIQNTGRNLFELDSMAERLLSGSIYEKDFHDFYLKKHTNVKGEDKYARMLNRYYSREIKKVNAELEDKKAAMLKDLEKKNVQASKLVSNYRDLLLRREKFRMESYGFNWSELGWINIDTGIVPKNWGPKRLEVKVSKHKTFDRVYTYVIYSGIKSIYRLNSDDNENFYVGNEEDKEMLMPEKSPAHVITIAYQGDSGFLAFRHFETGSVERLSLNPVAADRETIKKRIREYDIYGEENQLAVDVKFMDLLTLEQQRQHKLMKESDFFQALWRIVYSCCNRPVADTISIEAR